MPPWHADAPAGTFHNERIARRIAERQTLSWRGPPAARSNGDPKDLPAAPTFAEGWTLGKPDVVLEMQEDYSIAGDGHHPVRVVLHPDRISPSRSG